MPDLTNLPGWHRYLCERLREARKDRDLTGHQLGDLADITQNEISRYERGETVPSLPRLYRLASALELDIHCLIQAGQGDEA